MLTSTAAHTHPVDAVFDAFAASVQRHFDAAIAQSPYLFTVETSDDLYDHYLGSFPADQIQYHNCHACRSFIRRFGNLVSIDEHGHQSSAVWGGDSIPDLYQAGAASMAKAVARGRVTGVFLSSDLTWGTPEAGGFTHFAIRPPQTILHRKGVMTAGQMMAQKKQDYGTLSHGLSDFSVEVVGQALTLLQSESLYRSEKVIGPAKFLHDLHLARAKARGAQANNLVWLAVAKAPVGFATPRSSMVGTLLEDLAAGMDTTAVAARFKSKMNPLQYQRPQAAPTSGAIRQAEKLVEEMGIAPAFERRFARLEEVQTIWTPTAVKVTGRKQPEGGMFGHLAPKGKSPSPALSDGSEVNITWAKFAKTVLPNARKIELYMASSMAFCGVVTAVHADAPPIIQWDSHENRNPFSWYFYSNGSAPSDWNLRSGTWVNVTGIMLKPNLWGEKPLEHQGTGAILILEGAKDRRDPQLCLFPEILKSELHPVRSVVEAYNRSKSIEGKDEGTANGVMVGNGNRATANKIRVTTDTGVAWYHIDRWD